MFQDREKDYINESYQDVCIVGRGKRSSSGMDAGQSPASQEEANCKMFLTNWKRTESIYPLRPLIWRKGQLSRSLGHQVKLKLTRSLIYYLQCTKEYWARKLLWVLWKLLHFLEALSPSSAVTSVHNHGSNEKKWWGIINVWIIQ